MGRGTSNSDESELQQEKRETTLLTPSGSEQSSPSISNQSDTSPSSPMSEEAEESLTTMNFVEETKKMQAETDIWEGPDTNE